MEITSSSSSGGRIGITIAYCIFRARQLQDHRRPPLVVLHGGPSIPSNYLLSIVHGVTDRAIVFYDQWGCGKSSRPPSGEKFSMDIMVDHLHQLLTLQWGLESFHLLGHSFGGLLAYEYLLKHRPGKGRCRSVILASTPTSASLIESESKRLFRKVNNLSEGSGDDDDDDDDGQQDRARKQHLDENFRQTHECRLAHTPLSLIDALAQAGPTPWRGIQAISDYKASRSLANIPALVLVGEYDFCTTACVEGWNDLISNPAPETTTLTNCSHYGMLEDERQYGTAITNFLHQHDELK
jgi:proline-specific peptidase